MSWMDDYVKSGLVSNRRPEPSATEWLEHSPDMEEAVIGLCRMIKAEADQADLLEVCDYLAEFFENDDPVANGWVGSDGQP